MLFQSIQKFIEFRKSISNKTIGFVPTMGALHNGHIELIKKSNQENDMTVCSIFVNPTQFNNPEDLEKYPRQMESDLELLKPYSVIVLNPQFEELYPDNYNYKVLENQLSKDFCGKFRPGHFEGMLTVVLKLLNITQATKAYFGEKDFQQLSLIQGMCEAFFISTEIIPVETQRDEFGLALSSRNKRLTPQGIDLARKFAAELRKNIPINEIKNNISNLGIEIEYIEPLTTKSASRKLAAVWIEGVRLIDNV